MLPYYVDLIGLTAGSITVVAFIPQIIKIYRRKSAKDLSWLWLAAFFSGVFIWVIYALLASSLAVLISNTAMLSLGVVVMALKVKYDRLPR